MAIDAIEATAVGQLTRWRLRDRFAIDVLTHDAEQTAGRVRADTTHVWLGRGATAEGAR